MEQDHFREQLRAYEHWKIGLIQSIEDYRQWLGKHTLADPENEARICHTLDALRHDRLMIAFVAEFSRGKSELINAIFFADSGKRLLPCSPGRTTMCPTELFYDHDRETPYIRLLPIETRRQDTTIAEFRNDPDAWTFSELDPESPEQLETAFQELIQVNNVSLKEARALGLYQPEVHGEESAIGDGTIEIPRWRHAIISFPHQLLKQGLTILDTPGLNALGSEPELTVSLLPSAQAILFVLGADTGVTRSDQEIWQEHIHVQHDGKQTGLAVVLNKIDTLWDDLKTDDEVEKDINDQVNATAEMLKIPVEKVFPVSAQKGLVGRVRGDDDLLKKSRLADIEAFLGDDIVAARQRIVFENVRLDVGNLINNSRHAVEARMQDVRNQRDELHRLQDQNDDAIQQMLTNIREEQKRYLQSADGFEQSRKLLSQQAGELLELLDIDDLDHRLLQMQREMVDRWTTMGLRSTMKSLFEQMRSDMRDILHQADKTSRLLDAIYRNLQEEHGLAAVSPRKLEALQFGMEMEVLNEEAETFRSSTSTAMSEQGFVVKKFFDSIVARARELFSQARQECETWSRSALTPLLSEMQERKGQIERRLQNLKRIGESRETLAGKMAELEQQLERQDAQLSELQAIQQIIDWGLPSTDEMAEMASAESLKTAP